MTAVSDEQTQTDVCPEPDSRVEEARQLWTVIKLGVFGLYRSQIPRMSAALAYRTLFSIIPVMVIALLIFSSFVSEDQIDSGVRRVMDFAGITQISVRDTGAMGGDAVDAAESSGSELETIITDLITRVNQSIKHVPAGWIAVMSIAVLIYAALSMLIEMERSFNQVCGAPHGRSWLKRLVLYWTILTLGTLMLAATFFVGDSFARWIVANAGEDSVVGAVLAGYGVSVLISTALLVAAYMTIPNVRVKFRAALAGAFVAAVLWEMGKWGFTAYVRSSTGYTKFYGSLALLPLFLLWIYLTWIIVLLGMQAAHALQHFSRLVDAGLRSLSDEKLSVAFIDPLIGVAAVRVICGRFEDAKPTTPTVLGEAIGVDAAVAERVLRTLGDAGILQEIAEGEDTVGWSPTRPADKLSLGEILDAMHRLDGFRTGEGGAMVPDDIRSASMQALDGKVVASLD
ncbi:MAG: YihY family inner membrane protein [Phycisphaerales bacterium]|nr:YihY family inner membrane protein [Phycisphaerales bacterium]